MCYGPTRLSQKAWGAGVIKAYGYMGTVGQGRPPADDMRPQRDAIENYCSLNGMETVCWYREEEEEAGQNRSELARMMVDLETNTHGVKTVVVDRLDSLAADIMVQEAIIRDFERMGVRLISAAEGPDLCSTDPNRTLIRHMFGILAQYEKMILVQKLKAARRRVRRNEGNADSARRYGDGSSEERHVIRRIRLMRRRRKGGFKGMTCQQIADRLNAEGVQTKRGKRWTAPLVHYFATRNKS